MKDFVTHFQRLFPKHIFWQENSKTFYLFPVNQMSTKYKCVCVSKNQWIVAESELQYDCTENSHKTVWVFDDKEWIVDKFGYSL